MSQKPGSSQSARNSQGTQKPGSSQSARNSQGAPKPGSSQPVRNTQGASQVDVNVRTVAEKAVHFILAHASHHVPLKHVDLKKAICPDMRIEEPLLLAKKMLVETFGYELVDLPSKAKAYVLVNLMRKHDHLTLDDSIASNRALLLIILAYIFMNRAPVEQRHLRRFLGAISSTATHLHLQNVENLLFKNSAVFIKDQYLAVEENDHGIFFQWGERAKLEIDCRATLEFVSEMFQEEDVGVWKLHLRDIEEMENGGEV